MAKRRCSSFRNWRLQRKAMIGVVLACGWSVSAIADEVDAPPLALTFAYSSDLTSVSGGARNARVRVLDDLQVGIDANLGRGVGWRGLTGHAVVLRNSGDRPNDTAGTLQGVDNIEVSRARVRLFEAWIEQTSADGSASVLAGLYDLNSEFYANGAASVLLAPAFGIGSELAATGPNGPSVFPSTALSVRVRVQNDTAHAQAAVLNAKSGVLGDPGGVDLHFSEGALVIAEAGFGRRAKLAAGAWRYTRQQLDWRSSAGGLRGKHVAAGAYVLAEYPLRTVHMPQTTLFARIGVSDGRTTPFSGGWQTGVLVDHVLPGRPDSRLSFGLNQARINKRERANGRDLGLDIGRKETSVEVTYVDRVVGPLTLQPSLQYVFRPGGARHAAGVLVSTVRVKVEY